MKKDDSLERQKGKDIRVSDDQGEGYQSIRWKDIRLSEYQMEGHQVIRVSGSNHYLISCYPDNHYLVSCYPDNHITINHTGSDVQQQLPKNET